MDMSSFLGSSASEPSKIEETYEENSPVHTPWGVEQTKDNNDDSNNSENAPALSDKKEKTKQKNPVAHLGCTSAKPGNSRPAEQPIKDTTKKCKVNKFAAIAETEEVTKQSQLPVQKKRIQAKKARLNVEEKKWEYKMEWLWLKEAKCHDKKEEQLAKLGILQQ